MALAEQSHESHRQHAWSPALVQRARNIHHRGRAGRQYLGRRLGVYEASLQRHHDRAEVWPRVEIQTFTGDKGATLSVENTGIGPAVIKSAVITVDGVAQQNMRSVLKSWLGAEPLRFGQRTIVDHGLRPGDKVDLLSLDRSEMPPEFWDHIGRIGVTICYASVFDDFWIVSSEHLGAKNVWREVAHCPAHAKNTDF
jgi:hypothetical protein